MNTEINVNSSVEANANEAVETINTEMQIIKSIQEDPNATFFDYVSLAKQGFYDTAFVNALHDIADKVALKMEPKNYDFEISELQNEMLATKDISKRFGIMEQITQLMNEQQGQGSEIRNRLSGISFKDIAIAYSKDIQAMVDSVVLDILKRGQYQVLKTRRAPKDGSMSLKSPAAPAEQITFELKGETYTFKAGKGRLNNELTDIATEYAKSVNDPEASKKPNFIAALKAGKVKGAKITKVETV